MAATTGRLIATALGLLLAVTACSDPDPEAILDEAMAQADATSTTTTTTTPPSTATTEPTTTTLSERDLAKAEIHQVVIDWYQLPIDSTQDGNLDLRLEALTGLLHQRIGESYDRVEQQGMIYRSREPAPIEITGITVDLADGTAEVDACTGSADEFLDAETLEVINAEDPSETSTSVFQLQLIDGQWKISEWFASAFTEREPCEFET